MLAESALIVSQPELILGKRVLVVEDGPTLTHGEMPFGAGELAAEKYRATEIVDPRHFAVGSIREVYHKYPHIGHVLPAMGYSEQQIHDLQETIRQTDCDLVLFATPIHLPGLVAIDKPALRVRYEYKDHSDPTLKDLLLKKQCC